MELFEEYDSAGILKTKRLVDFKARRISKGEFQELAESAGFRIVALYGDYAYSEFNENKSPFMLWELESGSAVSSPPAAVNRRLNSAKTR